MKERTIAASLEAYKEKARETIRSIERERMQLEFERKKLNSKFERLRRTVIAPLPKSTQSAWLELRTISSA